jgi:type I restriction enzyme M protein
MTAAAITTKLWNYCHVLRDDGMSYGDYPSASLRAGSEQLTYLLFLKMADERSRPPYLSPNGGNQPSPVLAGYDWASLTKKDGDALFDHYRHTLEELGRQKGLLGLIFTKSQNKFDSRLFIAALTLRAPVGVQSPVEIVSTRPSCGAPSVCASPF